MFGRGEIIGKGVAAPEGIVDPKAFFRQLIKDIPVEETTVEPVVI
jgi:hypothetical protein